MAESGYGKSSGNITISRIWDPTTEQWLEAGRSGLTVGVDPGISGAIAILDAKGAAIEVYDMPVVDGLVSGRLLFRSLWERRIRRVIVEKVNAMPGQGVSSMFKFGRSVGVVEGVVGALGVRFSWVAPGAWKRHHGLLRAEKEASRRLAIEKFPCMAEKLARKKDVGRAEALLIAEYGLGDY